MFEQKDYSKQLITKQQRLQQLLQPFAAPPLEVFASPAQNYRQRAEFRIWRQGQQLDYAMFEPGNNRKPILLDNFPIASQRINQLMPELKLAWQQQPCLSDKLFQVNFHSTLAGDALITLCYHRQLDATWQQAASVLAQQLNCQIIGRARKQRIVIERDYCIEKLQLNQKEFIYQQPEGSFSQPNAAINQQMLTWACRQLGTPGDDLLEMYCGNGNFSIPFARQVRKLLATEISKTSIKAALANAELNGITNLELIRLSAEELTQALNKVREFKRLAQINLDDYQFGTVFVDPPRAGMDRASCELTSRFNRILYISCNPNTLVTNLEQLSSTHRISACALFDQFPYTEHIEAGVLLQRII